MPHRTDSEEEWFDEEATNTEDLEFSRLQQAVWKEGYKQGVSGAKDVGLQKGFEEGFAECETLSRQLGELKGTLRTDKRLIGQELSLENLIYVSKLLYDCKTSKRALQQFGSANSVEVELLQEIDDLSTEAGKFTADSQPQNLSGFSQALTLKRLNLTNAVNALLRKSSVLTSTSSVTSVP